MNVLLVMTLFLFHTLANLVFALLVVKYKNHRVESVLQTAYQCQHRQIVFTIPKQLRKYFFFPFEDRFNLLFQAVRDTIYSILNVSYKKNKKGIFKEYHSKIKYTPGFFAFLHTFGRDLKWNPHIHILIAELKLGNNNSCIDWHFFDYDALSLRFQKILLDLLHEQIGVSFSKEKNSMFSKYKKGFYVYAESKKFKSFQDGVEYVTRYCGRVPISENRIINYDGSNVIFSFIDHTDDKYHEITASNFILMLLRHLLPSHFKIIRYYGFYRKKHSLHSKMISLIKEHLRNFRKSKLKHQLSISLSLNRDPYNCPKCDKKMVLVLYMF